MQKTSRLGLSAVLVCTVLLGGATLSGCTVQLTEPADAATSSSAPSTSSTSSTGSAGSAASSTDTDPRALEGDVVARLQRARWTDLVTQHFACDQGSFTLGTNSNALVVEVTGDCDTVTILTKGAIVLLPETGTVEIDDFGNTVIVASADQVVLTDGSAGNVVGWERGTPVIRDSGTVNTTVPLS